MSGSRSGRSSDRANGMTRSSTSGTASACGPYLADVFSSWVHHGNVKKLIGAYRYATTVPGSTTASRSTTLSSAPTSMAARLGDLGKRTTGRPTSRHRSSWGTPGTTHPVSSGMCVRRPTTVAGDDYTRPVDRRDARRSNALRGTSTCWSVFPNAVLISEPGGTTHAGSLFGNACVDNKSRKVPEDRRPAPSTAGRRRRHWRCAPLPKPEPPGGAVQAGRGARAAAAVPRLAGPMDGGGGRCQSRDQWSRFFAGARGSSTFTSRAVS